MKPSVDEQSYPDLAGPLARELVTLQIHGESTELERRVSRIVLGDVHALTLKHLILCMVEALGHTWGNDPAAWQAQLLAIEREHPE